MFNYTGKIRLRRASLVLSLASLGWGCIQQEPLPVLGECSEAPADRWYEYGEAGVGSCLASPSDLRVVPDPRDPSNHFILVANSNIRGNYTGGSLLAIDASSIDTTCPVNGMHELSTDVLPVTNFPGRMDLDPATGLLLMSVRSNGQLRGDLTDDVVFIDASDPRSLAWSDRGPLRWGPYSFVPVPADPWTVAINPWDQRAWVLSLTTHTLSALDLSQDPVQFLDLVGEFEVTDAVFDDADGSGSAPDFRLDSVQPSNLLDEAVVLSWVDGVQRLYFVDAGGALHHADSTGGAFVPYAGGSLLDPGAGWTEEGYGAAAVSYSEGGLLGLVAATGDDGLRRIGAIDAIGGADWSVSSSAFWEPAETWEGDGVFDPEWLVDSDGVHHLWYSGGEGLGVAIGHAEGLGRSSLAALGDLGEGRVLRASAGDWDSAAVFSPSVVKLGEQWLLYYTGHADRTAAAVPAGLGIGLATSSSPDGGFERTAHGLMGSSLVLDRGAPGEWDAEGVAAAAVLPDDGRLVLWYQGYDGARWQVGRATSVDGFSWTKDPANPVFEGSADSEGRPVRAFAYKASAGNYYNISGSIRGETTFAAFEGRAFESSAAPINFTIVGEQVLGRGDADSTWADGASAASQLDGGGAVVLGHQGSLTRPLVASTTGLGLVPGGVIELAGFAGGLTGLNGSAPELPLTAAHAVGTQAGVTAAFETVGGIAVAAGAVDSGPGTGLLTAAPSGVALGPGAAGSFDATGVGAPALLLGTPDCDRCLYYEGRNGDLAAIGLATDEGGWTRVDGEFDDAGLVLPRGPAGAWDDAGVGQPTVLFDGALYRMWFVGDDGSRQRIGYAWSEDGRHWDRYSDSAGVTLPVFDPSDVPFAADGVAWPRVSAVPGGFEMLFTGYDAGVPRIGRARSQDGIDWRFVPNPTTGGDTFTFRTRPGDLDPTSTIELGDNRNFQVVDGLVVHGVAASDFAVSPDGRWGVVANKRERYLMVMDLSDDSTGSFIDANVGALEAVIFIPQSHGIVGVRDVVFADDGQTLYASMGPLVLTGSGSAASFGTEGVLRVDLSQLDDRAEARALRDDVITAIIPTARGLEEDRGYESETNVGAGSLVLNSAEDRAYVTNFHDNSLYVLDLEAGARGRVIDVIRGLDEGPFEVILSPDESLAWVANGHGEGRKKALHSTLQAVCVDESSAACAYGRVVTTLSNVDSAAERCGGAR